MVINQRGLTATLPKLANHDSLVPPSPFPYKEITGIEDEAEILEHLGSHQWNLEAAVQDALNVKEGRGTIYSQTPSPRPPPSPVSQASVTSHTGRPGRRAVVRREGWLEWTANMAVYPLRFVLSAANELFQLIGTSTVF